MAGLVAAIHVGVRERRFKAFAERYVDVLKLTRPFTTWMPGTSPGMTRMASISHPMASGLAVTFDCSRRK